MEFVSTPHVLSMFAVRLRYIGHPHANYMYDEC